MNSIMMLTIGHSTHDFSKFVELLRQSHVTAVADVRSIPTSQFAPQFNRGALEQGLKESDVKYVYLGEELGARTKDATCYVDGRVKYGRLAQTSGFLGGIERLMRGSAAERIAVMCTEGEPLNCHRTVLIAQVLTRRGVNVKHVHSDGWIESHASAMERLMAKFGLAEPELFRTPAERIEDALCRQEERIAYVNQDFPVDRTADV
ncbi:DUF488 family protein [Streptomyces sp. NPDC056937]|uniref:DUF488 domain-containing protein n=1 Tax=Streptomyces sp. NPDC056937 TaxID=3345969 RepID=UPI0036333792